MFENAYFSLVSDTSLMVLAAYDGNLVALSVAIAIATATLGLHVVGIARRSQDRLIRGIAVASGALALGVGVWAMHFIGMLALRLCATVTYDLPLTLLSMLPSLFAAWVALDLLIGSAVSNRRLIASGVLVGAGIGAMHYLGMQAMVMTPLLRYHPAWFALSIVVAVGLAILSLWIGYSRISARFSPWQRLLISGAVMGGAISGMHYTAMRAAVFLGTATSDVPIAPKGTWVMTLLITGGTLLLGLVVLGANIFVRNRELTRQAVQARAELAGMVEQLKLSETALEQRVERRTQALAQSNERLRATAARLDALIHTIPDMFWMKDVHGVYQSCNRIFERFFGASESHIIGKSDYDFMDQHLADASSASDQEAMSSGKPLMSEESLNFADDGRQLVMETIKTPIYDTQGKLLGVLGIARDVTARKAAEDEIRSLALFDTLTRLPNRRFLIDRLRQALASSSRHQQKGALLFIDLDNFKTINDTLGHHRGDLLLEQVGQRLSSCVREGDTVARLGGDEFVVMLENLSKDSMGAATQAEVVGQKVLGILNQSYQVEGRDVRSTPSIGITVFGGDLDTDIDEPLKRADLAMYQAKAAGRNTLRFFDPAMQAVVVARAAMESALRDAIEQQQILLYYQPQVVEGGRVTGAEVLLRWQHPERGMVSPAEFIPLAEETGLILLLGQWVLDTACRQLALWAHVPGRAGLTISVNVSARQFHRADFVDQVLSVLAQTGANPRRLKLELTEGVLVDNVDDVVAKMRALKTRGVAFSLDDFGTGYSSLSYLKKLPLDQLKIDQGFIRDILSDPDDAAISKMVISLADSMELDVIAEGVETLAQQRFLAEHGCRQYQGYLFGRPMPVQDFEAMLDKAATDTTLNDPARASRLDS